MHLAILGAGAIGPASAALAVSRGHSAVLWSPSGAGTRGLNGLLQAEGMLEGAFPVAVADTLDQAFTGADAVLLTVPAYALPPLLPRIAAAMPTSLPLLIAPAASLAPLAFARLRGPGAPVGAIAISGGAGQLDLIRQLLADATGTPVIATAAEEPVLLGASILGGVAAGLYPDMSAAMSAMTRAERRYAPQGGEIAALHDRRYAAFVKLQSLGAEL